MLEFAKSKQFLRRIVLAIFVIGTVAGAIIAADPSRSEPDQETSENELVVNDAAIHVRAVPAGSVEPPPTFSRFRGTIQSRRESMLAFRRGGRVAEIRFHEGDRVAAGELLAILDTSDLVAQRKRVTSELGVARAQLSEALAGPRKQTIEAAAAEVRRLRADLSLARAELSRESTLRRRDAGSERSYDAAVFAVDQLDASVAAAQSRHAELVEGTRREQIDAKKAAVAVAEAAVAGNEVDFEHVQIVAPYDGIIAERFVDEGAVVSPDSVAMHLIEVPPLEARVGLPNHVAASLRAGDRVQLERTTGRDTLSPELLEATVKRIHPTLSLQTRTRNVDVQLQADAPVISGETITLRLEETPDHGASEEKYWVPTIALVRGSRGLWSLMVAVDSSPGAVIERRDVQVVRTTGPFSEVTGMLQRGDHVVVEGVNRIGPGVRVIVADSISDDVSRDAT